jgi:hypothetical protein
MMGEDVRFAAGGGRSMGAETAIAIATADQNAGRDA